MGIGSKVIQAAAGSGGNTYYIGAGINTVFTLLEFDGSSISVAATYTLAGSARPNGVAVTPDGNYFAVAVFNPSTFTLLDHTTQGSISLATTYTLAGDGNGTDFSSDGDYIAVANGTSPFFTLLNHTTPGSVSLAATYTLSGIGNGCSFSPNDSYIAVCHSTSPYFTLLNHSSGSVSLATTYTLQGTPGGGNHTAWSPNGSYIACAHAGGGGLGPPPGPGFTLLNHSSGSVSLADTYTVSAFSSNLSVDFTSDGNYIATGFSESPRFDVLDHTTAGSVSLASSYTLSGICDGVQFSPDDNYVATADRSDDLTILSHSSGSVSFVVKYTGASDVNALAWVPLPE